jgi:hypothetical protein
LPSGSRVLRFTFPQNTILPMNQGRTLEAGTASTASSRKSGDRWMHVLTAIVFVVLYVSGVHWMYSIGVFHQPASFRWAEIGMFLICAAILLINIVGRLPALLRWLRARFRGE